MNKFTFTKTRLQDLYIIEPTVWYDDRGFFMETYNQKEFSQAGLDMMFVQDNHSCSTKGVLRGLHYQWEHPQGKLIRVISGKVFDVAVDVRPESLTYLDWFSVILSNENKKQFYIPPGFAHGFLVISDHAELVYKCTDFYAPENERGIRWNDPAVGILWPDLGVQYTLSDKDNGYLWL